MLTHRSWEGVSTSTDDQEEDAESRDVMVGELDVHWGGGAARQLAENRGPLERPTDLSLMQYSSPGDALCSRAVLAAPTRTFIALARAMFEEANAVEVAGEDLRGPPASSRESGQAHTAPQGLQVPGAAGGARTTCLLFGRPLRWGRGKNAG